MDNIEDLLRALAEDEDDQDETPCDCKDDDHEKECDGSGGLFSELDPQTLINLLGVFEKISKPDDNERFLLALKPLLHEENRSKIDSAIRLLKLFTLLPLLKSSGMFDNFGKLL